MATVVLFDPTRASRWRCMDGRTLTAMRTAAVSAAVTKRSPRRQVACWRYWQRGRAASHLRSIRHVSGHSTRSASGAERGPRGAFRDAIRRRATDAESAVRGADVVVTATPARDAHSQRRLAEARRTRQRDRRADADWRELDDEAMAMCGRRVARSRVEGIGRRHPFAAPIMRKPAEIFAGSKAIARTETTYSSRSALPSRTLRRRSWRTMWRAGAEIWDTDATAAVLFLIVAFVDDVLLLASERYGFAVHDAQTKLDIVSFSFWSGLAFLFMPLGLRLFDQSEAERCKESGFAADRIVRYRSPLAAGDGKC